MLNTFCHEQIEWLFVKFHHKNGATIFEAVTERCLCYSSAPAMGVGTSEEYPRTSFG